jgi:hypothetical protein
MKAFYLHNAYKLQITGSNLTRTIRSKANHFLAMAKKRATLSRKARKGKLVRLELKQ